MNPHPATRRRTGTCALLCLAPLVLVIVGPVLHAAATKGASDIVPPTKRQTTVDTAAALTKPPVPTPLPENVRHPFNPPEFNPAPVKAPEVKDGKPAVVPDGPSNRELLEKLAALIPNASTIVLRGKPILLVGRNRLEVGSEFVVTYNGQDYDLTLTAIDNTTFTLRYRGEETTRPLRIAK